MDASYMRLGVGVEALRLCNPWIFQLLSRALFIGPSLFLPSAMSAPTNVAVPPLPISEKAVAKPTKKPYPFWLGGTTRSRALLIVPPQ
jgi:hypothetical protein